MPGRRSAQVDEVLGATTCALRDAFGERLLAVYAIGSLAHGGFTGLVSDIDVAAIILDPIQPADRESIRSIATKVAAERALGERLSLFWGARSTFVAEEKSEGRFPAPDRLDLLDHGLLLTGTEARSDLTRPTLRELLAAGAAAIPASLSWRDAPSAHRAIGHVRRAAVDASPTEEPSRVRASALSKSVLFPVRLLFTAATGLVDSNEVAATWYMHQRARPSQRLVAAALLWREEQPDEQRSVAGLLRDERPLLYRHFVEDYARHLTSVGLGELAHALLDWHRQVARDAGQPLSSISFR